jgi:hypothetical protein
MLTLICSGCQTGADLGGLIAAEKFGIPTGGYMPKGYRTEVGPKPEWAKRFNLQESSCGYIGRTYENAKLGDGTIRFAYNFDSPGEICTLNACQKYNKPVIDVDIENARSTQEVVDWIKVNNIKVLNVAGNRGSVYPAIQGFVENYLVQVFEALK